ncbi:MAG: hypothetical protein ACYCUM_09580 [Solirubrobacteraceae bacterium]
MVLDPSKIKAQAIGLGEPVSFTDRDAEEFLHDVQNGPSSALQEQLRAAVKAAAAVETTSNLGALLR